jgi:hypothetical protein
MDVSHILRPAAVRLICLLRWRHDSQRAMSGQSQMIIFALQ